MWNEKDSSHAKVRLRVKPDTVPVRNDGRRDDTLENLAASVHCWRSFLNFLRSSMVRKIGFRAGRRIQTGKSFCAGRRDAGFGRSDVGSEQTVASCSGKDRVVSVSVLQEEVEVY